MFYTFCKSLAMQTNYLVKIIIMVIDMSWSTPSYTKKKDDGRAAANELVYRAVHL